MRNIRTAVLASAAALLAAGTAMAASKDTKMMTVGLPDGSIAHVRYVGDVAPKVVFVEPLQQFTPIGLLAPQFASSIVMLDQISATMDEQIETMMRQMRALDTKQLTNDGKPQFAAFGSIPNGTVSYSFVSTSNGNHSCTRGWQVTSSGQAQPPKVIQASSGDCDDAAVPGRATPNTQAPLTAAAAHSGPATTAVRQRSII